MDRNQASNHPRVRGGLHHYSERTTITILSSALYASSTRMELISNGRPLPPLDIPKRWILNFPLMDINRNAARKVIELSDPNQGEKLTKIWGDDSWKELAYTVQEQLFDKPILVKIRGNETLKQGFMGRLKNQAGFSYVPEPILMRNQQGGPLYFLFFAAHKPIAQSIAQDIFRKWGNA